MQLSVVIPARNAAATIGFQLEALTTQETSAVYEVIVVDNGSTDGTARIAAEYAQRSVPLQVVDATGRANVAYARNVGVQYAQSNNLAFCDADDIVASHWVDAMSRALNEHEHVTGPIGVARLARAGSRAWGASVMNSHDVPTLHFRPWAQGCNFGIQRGVLEDLGGFREEAVPWEDIDLSWRAQSLGPVLYFVPSATIHRRPRATLGAAMHQAFGYGQAKGPLYRAFRDSGMPRSSLTEILSDGLATLVDLLLAFHTDRRWAMACRLSYRAGRLSGSARARVFYP